MPLVRGSNSGAMTLLAHFHYCGQTEPDPNRTCDSLIPMLMISSAGKGNQPFGEKFDWDSTKNRRMARLDAEQSRFMAGYRDRVIAKGQLHSCGSAERIMTAR